MMTVAEVRAKWNRRYEEKAGERSLPRPNELALRFRRHIRGGTMLDAACGLGAGIAAAIDRVDRVIAVDISDAALRAARELWGGRGKICWIQADVSKLSWPDAMFSLVCAFGFTDWDFLRQVPRIVAPGGLFLYQGFSRRQLAVKPRLDPHWTSTPQQVAALFPAWRRLACEESDTPPYRVSFAGLRPCAVTEERS